MGHGRRGRTARRLRQADGRGGFLSWRRKWARWVPTGDVETRLPALPDASADTAERDALVAEIRQLPARQRTAVTLRFYEDWSYAEIAVALGCAETGARSLVSRGLGRLRVRIGADPAPDPVPDVPHRALPRRRDLSDRPTGGGA